MFLGRQGPSRPEPGLENLDVPAQEPVATEISEENKISGQIEIESKPANPISRFFNLILISLLHWLP